MLIIGNKPYFNIKISRILDKFKSNTRCNMSLPDRNNGTICDEWALCNHLFENIFSKKLNLKTFKKIYEPAPGGYNPREIDFFFKNLNKYRKSYSKIYMANSTSSAKKFNKYLSKIGCPHKFTKLPRTGYAVLFDNLLSNKNVYVSNFSISDETRVSYYVNNGHYENDKWHSKSDEINIIRWLHKNNKIDATLCLLEDNKTPTLNCIELSPSLKVIDIILEVNGVCYLKNLKNKSIISKYNHNTDKNITKIYANINK